MSLHSTWGQFRPLRPSSAKLVSVRHIFRDLVPESETTSSNINICLRIKIILFSKVNRYKIVITESNLTEKGHVKIIEIFSELIRHSSSRKFKSSLMKTEKFPKLICLRLQVSHWSEKGNVWLFVLNSSEILKDFFEQISASTWRPWWSSRPIPS